MQSHTTAVDEAGAMDRCRSLYAEMLVPLALRGLDRMFLPSQRVFCDRATGREAGEIVPVGVSNRYTAMVLIGLASAQRNDASLGSTWDDMARWAKQTTSLGDAGLVLWALVLKKDDRACEVAEDIISRQEALFARLPGYQSMPLGWFLAGAGEALRAGVEPEGLREIASGAAERLLANRNEETGLFSFGDSPARRHPVRSRVNRRLGSFATQVYPTMGLAAHSLATGDEAAGNAAIQCADRICELQGPSGQWWWIYQVRTGTPAVKYPVYTVHQDAMGPMALLSVSRAAGNDYSSAIRSSLAWLNDHAECPEARLIDEDRGVVWRAVQRDDATRTGDFGLGPVERARMSLAAWLGKEDTRPFITGHLCRECRPYHLGWILLAAAMAEAQNGC